jgi:lipopolysaccharide export system protein LptA
MKTATVRSMMAALLMVVTLPALAEDTAKQAKPVDIESDRMEIKDKEKQAVFTGNVNAKRSDVTLTCDSLVVDYSETKQSDGTTKSEVTNLDAKGHVVIVTAKQKITGEWAKMNVTTNDVVVGGNVVLVQGDTVLKGPKLTANLDTNKVEVSGGRVKGSFLPK